MPVGGVVRGALDRSGTEHHGTPAPGSPQPDPLGEAGSSRGPVTAVQCTHASSVTVALVSHVAGDALPVARAFAAVADRVITHPNVMNGAQLYWPDPKLLYVEGYALDQFATGRTGLRPVTSQRVGLLLDAAIEPELRLRHPASSELMRFQSEEPEEFDACLGTS